MKLRNDSTHKEFGMKSTQAWPHRLLEKIRESLRNLRNFTSFRVFYYTQLCITHIWFFFFYEKHSSLTSDIAGEIWRKLISWLIDWLLLNLTSAIFQPYHGGNIHIFHNNGEIQPALVFFIQNFLCVTLATKSYIITSKTFIKSNFVVLQQLNLQISVKFFYQLSVILLRIFFTIFKQSNKN